MRSDSFGLAIMAFELFIPSYAIQLAINEGLAVTVTHGIREEGGYYNEMDGLFQGL